MWGGPRGRIKLRHDSKQCIDLRLMHTFSSEIGIWFRWLLNLLIQVTNHCLHHPLHIADWGSLLQSLWNKVNNLVNSGLYKMDAVMTKLIVHEFKVIFSYTKEGMDIFELLAG